MSWQIAKRQLLLNILTFRFAVGTAVCVLLAVLLVPVLIEDYKARLENYTANVALNDAELRKLMVYKNLTPTVYRPPSALAVFSKGVEGQVERSAKISLGGVPQMREASSEVNPFLEVLPDLDFSLIFASVISLLALLVAYDAVSGERERGTLKLLLSGPTPRYQLLLGRLASGMLTLLIPVSVAFIVAALMLELSPMVALSGSDWMRIGLMYITSLLFVFCMHNLAMFFSSVTKRATTALMFSLLSWVCFVAVIPNASLYVAVNVLPLPGAEAKDEVARRSAEVWGEYEQEESRYHNSTLDYDWRSDERGAFGQYFLLTCSKGGVEYHQGLHALVEPVRIRCADRAAELQRGYLEGFLKQRSLAENISRASPVSVYGVLMSALAGTDAQSFEHFFHAARMQRAKLIEYVRSKTDGFSTPSFSSQVDRAMSEEVEALIDQMRTASRGEKQPLNQRRQELYNRMRAAVTPLDLSDLPPMTAHQESGVGLLRRALPDLALLAVSGVLLFVLSFAAFVGYDVR